MSKQTTSTARHPTKHLPKFPDEDTPAQWIWPPYAGRNILNQVIKYALKARLQPDGTWVINAKNRWRCFSKLHWLYTNTDLAFDALRANMRMHLQCSPIISEQRCVAVASDIKNSWRLWQIVHLETTLAEDLTNTLKEKQPDILVIEMFKCASRYADALQQCTRYPPSLNPTLDDLGMDAKLQLVYLGTINDNKTTYTIQPLTEKALADIIKQAFATPIAEALPHLNVEQILKEIEKIDGFDQQYLQEVFKNLIVNCERKL
jgi:hypothetical protein